MMTDAESENEPDNAKTKDRLIKHLKKEVKQIMEEAVTRKYINEDSSSITALCSSVEACLAYGLKRRTLGLFKTASSTAALLQKISKNCPEAEIVRRVQYSFEPSMSMTSFGSRKGIFDSRKNSKSLPPLKKMPGPVMTHKYLWIRIALTERVLDKIVDYLVKTADKYYAPESLIADPTDGPIIASLLVGPCALDFSKMKTPDHLWTDPSADELVLRHRIHGSAVQYQVSNGSLSSPKRFGLNIKRTASHSSSSCDEPVRGAAKDYVESLHQNSKTTLLYGKNNVLMRPKDRATPMHGYLSLHQGGDVGLTVKWTPNQLMNTPADESFEMVVERSQYWDFALCIAVPTIVYLHCHHQNDNSGSIVLVGQDGIQYPPLQFPPGGHLLAFLSCLETGLEPGGRLDPPLWYEPGVGKVFPHLKRRTVQTVDPESASYDYVFRVVCDLPNLTQSKLNLIMHPDVPLHPLRQASYGVQSTNSNSDNFSSSASASNSDSPKIFDFEHLDLTDDSADSRSSMQQACDTMKKQLITRAFYGWMAHCRHLRTVRQHLSGLVVAIPPVLDSPTNASKGLTKAVWDSHQNGRAPLTAQELCRLIYFGGVDPSIRRQVWPCLLEHYRWDSSSEERENQDTVMRVSFDHCMSEWMAVEAIIRQKDKEAFAASLAKMNSQHSSDIPLVGKDTNLANDVFEDEEMSVSSTETPSEWTLSAHSASEPGRKNSLRSMPSKEISDEAELGNDEVLKLTSLVNGDGSHNESSEFPSNVMVTQATIDHRHLEEEEEDQPLGMKKVASSGFLGDDMKENECPSPASSIGGTYTDELVEEFALNLHRIDKDVARCDRTYPYFTHAKNLEKLRNIMSTYVWLNLKEGYVQGMCDIAAPLLVTFDDEVMAYSCFGELMKRMTRNFPSHSGMDQNFANMRSLIQVLDPELYDLMRANGDYTHFYFCYRWFLLDFKRGPRLTDGTRGLGQEAFCLRAHRVRMSEELLYDDVYVVWETIWAASTVASREFVLFLALAMLECYRDIILDNAMDFTDIIKFFNEMAERHDGRTILKISRDLVQRIQDLITTQ